MSLYDLSLYFFVYSFLGWCTEVAYAAVKEHRFVNRGFLNGPVCPIYGFGVSIVIALLTPYKENIIILYIFSVLLVTTLEGLTGWVMDIVFHNKWWDYSNRPLNIGGYVCLTFSLIWGMACVLIMDLLHPIIAKLLSFIPFTLGLVLIIFLSIIMISDCCVTATAIFKLNKHLDHMEKIARELHEISDQIGLDLSEKVLTVVEKQEESKLKRNDAVNQLKEWKMETSEELRYRIEELKKRYHSINHLLSSNGTRLVNAFPKMEPRFHKEQFDVLKQHFQEKKK